MGEIETLQVEKTDYLIKKLHLEEEIEKLQNASAVLWDAEYRIRCDYNQVTDAYDVIWEWNGNCYHGFMELYQGTYTDAYLTYSSSLSEKAEAVDDLIRQKEDERDLAEEMAQFIQLKIDRLLEEEYR